MGELKVYQPTKGMIAADRTVEGYRTVIKEWVHSLEDVLSPFYTMSDFTSGNGVNLSPIDSNISKVTQQIWVNDDSEICLWSMRSADGKNGAVITEYLRSDPKLYVWVADDGAGFGMTTNRIFMGVMNTISFDGGEQYISFAIPNTSGIYAPQIVTSNGTGYHSISYSSMERGSTNYCVKPHTCDALHLFNNHLYTLDGGMALPSNLMLFTINDEKYMACSYGTCFKF